MRARDSRWLMKQQAPSHIYDTMLMRRQDLSGSPDTGQLLVGLSSLKPFEVTVGLSLSRALKATETILSQSEAVASHPPNCTLAISAAQDGMEILGSSNFELSNYTGLDIQYWLVQENQRDSPPRQQGKPAPFCANVVQTLLKTKRTLHTVREHEEGSRMRASVTCMEMAVGYKRRFFFKNPL